MFTYLITKGSYMYSKDFGCRVDIYIFEELKTVTEYIANTGFGRIPFTIIL